MAYFDQIPSETLLSRLSRWLETPFASRQRRIAERIRRLRAMSDRELADLGLSRDDILYHAFRTP